MMVALAFVLSFGLLIWLGACAYLYTQQAHLLYPGDGRPFGGFEELQAMGGEALRGELDGIALRYYRVPAAGGAAPKAWVLLFHGNRDGARERFDFAQRLCPLGYAVVLAEYPGYAGEAGPTSQRQLLRYGLAMADELKRLAGGAPLFYFGESLGTAIATFAAMRRQPRGLLLSTPYPSLAAVAQHRYPVMPVLRLIQDPMPAEDWAPQVHAPVLIIHGRQDRTVPYALGVAQAKNFPQAPIFISIDGPGHSDIRDRYPEPYWGPVQRFIEARLAA